MECWVLGVVLQGTLNAAIDAACYTAAIPQIEMIEDLIHSLLCVTIVEFTKCGI